MSEERPGEDAEEKMFSGLGRSLRIASDKKQTGVKLAPPLTAGWMNACGIPIGDKVYVTEKERKLSTVEQMLRKNEADK